MRSVVVVIVVVATAGLVWAQTTRPASPCFLSAARAVGLEDQWATRVAFADFNNDDFPDIIIDNEKIFLSRERGRRFVRAESDANLKTAGLNRPTFVAIADVNNDGNLDLFRGRFIDLSNPRFIDDGLRHELWLGQGDGSFKPFYDSNLDRFPETALGACFVDYNRDGNLDLFLANAYAEGRGSYVSFPDRLFRGEGDGSFSEVTEDAGLLGVPEVGLSTSRRPTYGVTHADWNNDRWPDLIACVYGRQENRLWKNNGDGTFTDVAVETRFHADDNQDGRYPEEVRALHRRRYGEDRPPEPPFRANGNTREAAFGDFDNDGDLDCFLVEQASQWMGPSADRSMLLVNRGSENGFKFCRDPDRIDRTHAVERWNEGDENAGWIDVDNDGRLDLLLASSDFRDEQLLRLYHQGADGSFEDWTDRLGFRWRNASQISLADFDRDGATDILVSTTAKGLGHMERQRHDLNVGLFRNVLPQRLGHGFFNLRLRGQCIGARVRITIGDQTQMREIRSGAGHAGHRDDTDCRFGVGKAEKIDRVEVWWPGVDQELQFFSDVPTNRFYELEPGGVLKSLDVR